MLRSTQIKFESITKEQFDRYEEVRMGGRWNMFDPNAIMATGLSREVYVTIMRHYTALCEKYDG